MKLLYTNQACTIMRNHSCTRRCRCMCLYITHIVHCSLCNGVIMACTSFPVLFLYQIAVSLLRIVCIFVIYAFISKYWSKKILNQYSLFIDFFALVPCDISSRSSNDHILKFSRHISHAIFLLQERIDCGSKIYNQ